MIYFSSTSYSRSEKKYSFQFFINIRITSVYPTESNDILTIEIWWTNQNLQMPNAPNLGPRCGTPRKFKKIHNFSNLKKMCIYFWRYISKTFSDCVFNHLFWYFTQPNEAEYYERRKRYGTNKSAIVNHFWLKLCLHEKRANGLLCLSEFWLSEAKLLTNMFKYSVMYIVMFTMNI